MRARHWNEVDPVLDHGICSRGIAAGDSLNSGHEPGGLARASAARWLRATGMQNSTRGGFRGRYPKPFVTRVSAASFGAVKSRSSLGTDFPRAAVEGLTAEELYTDRDFRAALEWRLDMSDPEREAHISVLPAEVLEAFAMEHGDDFEGLVIDGTLGAGGHTRLLLDRFPRIHVLGIDQDPQILALARENLAGYGDRVVVERARISDLARILRKGRFDRPVGMLFDLGCSSLQIDTGERGFSFLKDGPLDMRMDPSRERTAADIVNNWDEGDLADLFFYEGDERGARRIARVIVEGRRQAPFRRTGALAELIARAMGRHGGGRIHPATRTFQALRRAVNEEGEEQQEAMRTAECFLADGGVLAVISFHSGEDGLAKRYLAESAKQGNWRLQSKKPVRPTREEERRNPRARSARLRAAVRTRRSEMEAEDPKLTRDGSSGGDGEGEGGAGS